jgi:hypothetical protein
MAAPAGVPQTAGSYVVAEVRVVAPQPASIAKPVRVTFLRTDGGWKLVGVDRMTAQGTGSTPMLTADSK